jgi:hypothetical protein
MAQKMTYAFPRFDAFMKFIIERHRIYERREKGAPPPWTTDKILQTYRFCNVYRELDRVTQWIATEWRTPNESYKDLWFAMVVARLLNRIETLEALAFPREWNHQKFLQCIQEIRADGLKVFSAAYIVSTGGKSMDKAKYLAEYVLDPLWKQRLYVRPRVGDTLMTFFNRLRQYDGMGSFMAAQIVADIKYVYPLLHAPDWWTFASSGPGSRRGMSYVMGIDPKKNHWREHEWRDALNELAMRVTSEAKRAKLPRIHNQDLQNCLCEFSKYSRTVKGTGRPKQKFTPHQAD